MNLKNQSKFALFVYKFLTFELVGQLLLSLLPSNWRDGFYTEFFLRGFLFVSLFGVTLWSFLRIFWDFKSQGFFSFIPLALLVLRIVFIPTISQLTQSSKFYIAQKMYSEVITDAEKSMSKQKNKNFYVKLPSKYWYISDGIKERVEFSSYNNQKIVFFEEFIPSGFPLDLNLTSCGFMYASMPVNWEELKEIGVGDAFDFWRVSEKWFFGCRVFGW